MNWPWDTILPLAWKGWWLLCAAVGCTSLVGVLLLIFAFWALEAYFWAKDRIAALRACAARLDGPHRGVWTPRGP